MPHPGVGIPPPVVSQPRWGRGRYPRSASARTSIHTSDAANGGSSTLMVGAVNPRIESEIACSKAR